MNDEQIWKRRFLQLTLVRLIGLTVFMAGIALMFSDLIVDGGWPRGGAILAIVGTLTAVLAQRLLRRLWERS